MVFRRYNVIVFREGRRLGYHRQPLRPCRHNGHDILACHGAHLEMKLRKNTPEILAVASNRYRVSPPSAKRGVEMLNVFDYALILMK